MSESTVTNADLAQKVVGAVGAIQDAQKDLVEGAKKLAVHLAEKNAHDISGTVGEVFNNAVHISGDQNIAGQKTFTTPPVVAKPTNEGVGSLQAAPVSWVRDMLRAEVEKMSSGRNTVIRDKNDNPHVMVVIPRFNLQDIDASLGTGPHPAFIVNGVVKNEILVGKFLASKSSNGLAQTLPHQAPWGSILFDNAVAACRALGQGFAMCTNATYAARALWLMKQLGEHTYYGNTYWGRSHISPWQTGVMQTNEFAPGDTGNGDATTLTGTGPVEWNDDGTSWGISDYIGNFWEWTTGVRLNNGEINVIKDNDAMLSTIDFGANSTSWKAISPNNSLCNTGITGTLKYDAQKAGDGEGKSVGDPVLSTKITNPHAGNDYCYGAFKDMQPISTLTPPAIVKILGLYPALRDGSVNGYVTIRNQGERVCYRNGGWGTYTRSGPFAALFNNLRTTGGRDIGFRVSYVS